MSKIVDNKELEAVWEARLRRLGLSMSRNRPQSLTYVDPQRLLKISERRQAQGKKVDID